MRNDEITERIVSAFESLETEFSTDRVIADPDLNESFITACVGRGLEDLPSSLNWQLMNLRKAGKLKRKGRVKRTSFSDEPDYRFAAEIAVRVMERQQSRTLDEVLCDPILASLFVRPSTGEDGANAPGSPAPGA